MIEDDKFWDLDHFDDPSLSSNAVAQQDINPFEQTQARIARGKELDKKQAEQFERMLDVDIKPDVAMKQIMSNSLD